MIEFFPSRTVAIELFGFAVHWYGLLYLAGFLLGYVLLPHLQRYRGLALSKEDWAEILSFSVIGVIVGGRLGYVLLYDPMQYVADPLEIFAVWNGGMASHGGFIGVFLALLYVTHKRHIPLLQLFDVVVVPVAIGLALGRLGNFINQELYGTVTNLPWGISIPNVEGLRHPTQLYAMLKDLLIAAVCFVHLRLPSDRAGRTGALFVGLYAILRFLIEFLRVPSHAPFIVGALSITRGQTYTIPLLLIAIALWVRAGKRMRNEKVEMSN